MGMGRELGSGYIWGVKVVTLIRLRGVTGMHDIDNDTSILTQAILGYSRERLRMDPPTLDAPCSPEELAAKAGRTITADGLGGDEALRLFTDILAPACISIDHPKFLAFVPAPTEAATLFDLVVGASSICASSWLEAAGAIYAENEALRWISDLAGFPEEAGGVFVSGGTAGNLSALVAARDIDGARKTPSIAKREGW